MFLSAAALLALLIAGLWTALGSTGLAAPLSLLLLAAIWPFVNASLEGPVLWVLGGGHGLTLSDLLCPIGVAGAVIGLLTRRNRQDAG